mgnify:CR=1 FL=1
MNESRLERQSSRIIAREQTGCQQNLRRVVHCSDHLQLPNYVPASMWTQRYAHSWQKIIILPSVDVVDRRQDLAVGWYDDLIAERSSSGNELCSRLEREIDSGKLRERDTGWSKGRTRSTVRGKEGREQTRWASLAKLVIIEREIVAAAYIRTSFSCPEATNRRE